MIIILVIAVFLFIVGIILASRDFEKLDEYAVNRKINHIIALMIASALLGQVAWLLR